jgi:flagellar assembly factor FliW
MKHSPGVACESSVVHLKEQDMTPICPASSPSRVLENRRFGRLAVHPEQIVSFPAGLLGFEELHEYVLVAPEGLEPISFLVAMDDPDVAFPILPATLCMAGYAPSIPPDALETIGAGPEEHLELLAICTSAPDTGTLHANLRGPVVVNPATRKACQAVLHDTTYSLRHLLGAC